MVPVITYSRLYEITATLRYRIASGPTTSVPTSEQTSQPTNQPSSGKTLQPTSQPSSETTPRSTFGPSSQKTSLSTTQKTPRPTSGPQETCYERELMRISVLVSLAILIKSKGSFGEDLKEGNQSPKNVRKTVS
ncbi:hypothetical protein KIN20_032710 [Parelaphostrongylus tenuis]|uniref:Uncharacterized protein n=1 Tax=Parelaphostrongylus tenuis TaxID=148309 RepID=A0AAD5R6V3_PARTN|nr:hypothetical protein KIN20_032710 [Parelaphostrongylus tenuis]